MKKIHLFFVLLFLFVGNAYTQIQEYFINSYREQYYNSSLQAWGDWSGLISTNENSVMSNKMELKISDNGIEIIKSSYSFGCPSWIEITTITFSQTPMSSNGYSLYSVVKIHKGSLHTNKECNSTEFDNFFDGYIYSSNIDWNTFRNGEGKKYHKISLQYGTYRIEFNIDLYSNIYYEEKQQAKQQQQKELIQNSAKLLEMLIKKK